MKIFILSDISSTHTKRWVKSLAERHCEILLFGLFQCDDSFYQNIPNVTVYNYNFSFKTNSLCSRWILGKILYFKSLKTIKQKIKEWNPDIVHAHYASSYGLLGALTHFHPYVISVWGSDVYSYPKAGWIYKKLLMYSLRQADRILSTSQCMAKETQLYTDKPISITPFGVDCNLFKPQPKDNQNTLIIGTVKTLSKNYGIDILIRAFAKVCKNNPGKDMILQIAGEGPDKKELKNLSVSLGIDKQVQFLGFVNNEKLPNIYNNFDIFVALSHKESFGVVAIEAMACNLPVITSDAEGFCEVVKDGETGFIVSRNNDTEASQAMQKLIESQELRNSMGDTGRLHVMKLYDWSKNVETMMSIYQQILLKETTE